MTSVTSLRPFKVQQFNNSTFWIKQNFNYFERMSIVKDFLAGGFHITDARKAQSCPEIL